MTSTEYDELIELLDSPFNFYRQPTPIPASLRPGRRVALLLLLVAKSHGSGASWKGIQLLNWAIKDRDHIDLLLNLRQSLDLPDRPIVRFEPALDRAIDLAVGIGLLESRASRVFRLTEAGKRVVTKIERSDTLTQERGMLNLIAGKMTQKEVARLLEWRVS